MHQVNIYMVGTAGSGKTYLIKGFSNWLDFKRLDNITVNLDPGAEKLPYVPDLDIREWFTLEDIIETYSVGPNGAQIIGADLIGTKIDEIKDEIDYQDAQFVLLDTPGQMELFTLRRSSEIIIDSLGNKNSVMVFLFDPVVSKTPSGFLSLLFMSASAIFRLNIPQIMVLAKSDILDEDEIKRVVEWSENPDKIYDALKMHVKRGMSDDLFHLMKDSGLFRPIFPVSAVDGTGMEDIYDGIQELFFGGEDLESILY
jgi:hypothetical protein